jgi:hypothetical protein
MVLHHQHEHRRLQSQLTILLLIVLGSSSQGSSAKVGKLKYGLSTLDAGTSAQSTAGRVQPAQARQVDEMKV